MRIEAKTARHAPHRIEHGFAVPISNTIEIHSFRLGRFVFGFHDDEQLSLWAEILGNQLKRRGR